MNPEYEIYKAPVVPPEDAARLDGYLKALNEADEERYAMALARMEQLVDVRDAKQ